MKISEIIKELQKCDPDEDVKVAIEYSEGRIEFYSPTFISLPNKKTFPVLINVKG